MYYILNEKHEPVLARDIPEWAAWMERHDRHVMVTEVGNKRLSTVFLGLDHGFSLHGHSQPVLFESLLFIDGQADEETMQRYYTWDEAEKGHRQLRRQYFQEEVQEKAQDYHRVKPKIRVVRFKKEE